VEITSPSPSSAPVVSKPILSPKLRSALILTGIAALLVLLTYWGGTPATGPKLYLGIGLLVVLALSFGPLVWWLYLSPLPGVTVQPQPITARTATIRQLVVVVLILAGTMMSIGGLWDQVWHQVFGGFGSDFLWPPHFLLYASIGLQALTALAGLIAVARGQGGLRERFRREPLLGLIAIAGTYLVVSIPSDEIWHRLYGLDLTGWSLPHILLGVMIHLVLLSAIAMQLSLTPRRAWQTLRGIRWQEFVAVLPLIWGMTVFIQLFTVDWEANSRIGAVADNYDVYFFNRPEWLYPVVLVVLGLYLANLILHASRRAGTATIVGVLALVFRAGVYNMLMGRAPQIDMGMLPYLVILPGMLVLDVWYAWRRVKAEENTTLVGGNALASVVMLIIGLPLIAAVAAYPRVNAATVPWMIVFSLLMGQVGGWAGASVGRWLGNIGGHIEEEMPVQRWLAWASATALVIALAVIFLYIRYAPPPTPS